MSDELLHAIVDRARRTFKAQACSILLHQPERRSLVFAAMSGEGSESLVGVEFSDDTGVAGWVLANREPLSLDDVVHDRRFAEDIAEIIGYVPRRLMATPLLSDGRALGVLEMLDCPEVVKFSEADPLRAFADEAVRVLGGS
jgi:GAF domain-containing protein